MKEILIELERPNDYKGRLPFIKGKARPRVVGKHAFSPESVFEKLLKNKAVIFKYDNQADFEKWDKNSVYRIEITCFFELPKSFTKAEIEQFAGNFYNKKPDCDNIAKAVMDCLVKAKIIDDDCLIIEQEISKYYQNFKDEKELIKIKLMDLKK